MFKCLFATCLTALSVNTQAPISSPVLEPSRAISGDTTFNVGDYVKLEVSISYGSSNNILLFTDNTQTSNQLKVIEYSSTWEYNYLNSSKGYPLVSYANFTTSFVYNGSNYSYFYGETYNYFGFTFNSENISSDSDIYTYSITFLVLEGFNGFTIEAMPYLTKIDYFPPSKSNLYRLLYDFYYSIFNDDDLTAISTGYNMPFDNWLAHTCTIATLITLIVVAFFFLRWLFKVVSGLILLKR